MSPALINAHSPCPATCTSLHHLSAGEVPSASCHDFNCAPQGGRQRVAQLRSSSRDSAFRVMGPQLHVRRLARGEQCQSRAVRPPAPQVRVAALHEHVGSWDEVGVSITVTAASGRAGSRSPAYLVDPVTSRAEHETENGVSRPHCIIRATACIAALP